MPSTKAARLTRKPKPPAFTVRVYLSPDYARKLRERAGVESEERQRFTRVGEVASRLVREGLDKAGQSQ